MEQNSEKHTKLYRILNIAIIVAVLGVIIALSSFAFLADTPGDSMLVSYISIDSTEESEEDSSSTSSSRQSTRRSSSKKTDSSEEEEILVEEPEEIIQMDINEATLEDLLQVDGIGETMANRILLYRDLAGGFDTLEDLMKVKDLSRSTYEGLAIYFYCVAPKRTLESYSEADSYSYSEEDWGYSYSEEDWGYSYSEEDWGYSYSEEDWGYSYSEEDWGYNVENSSDA